MSEDAELQAIDKLLSALEPLDPEARDRVIDYVFQRLNVKPRVLASPTVDTSHGTPSESVRGQRQLHG
jgi:hypothetical protein